MKKQIAIIGAGPAGLVAAKSCLEAGLTPVIFEKSALIGGVWSGGENGRAWDGMHTNISKWSCMFSDFPWPDTIQDFPTQSEVASYLKSYADAFQVTPHIRFQAVVSRLSKSGDKWVVEQNNHTEYFDAAIIVSGFFAKAMQPDISGQHDFTGKVIHASHVQQADVYGDDRVTICGGSFSGYELAVEFARVSNNPVTHVFNRAAWILGRYVDTGNQLAVPLDLLSYSRKLSATDRPRTIIESRQDTIDFFKNSFGNPGQTHDDLRVSEDPHCPPFVVVSEGYLEAVQNGKIIPVRGGIQGLDKNHLLLTPDTKIATDILVMATGYHATLPYLDESVKMKIGYDESDQFMPVLLHETVWAKEVEGLAFVGFYRGPYFGVMELQARWAAGVFAGDIAAPLPAEIDKGVSAAREIRQTVPRPQFPYANYVELADGLAKRVGCYPELSASDPFYSRVYDGCFVPSHFRLSGKYSNRAIAEQVIGSIPYIKSSIDLKNIFNQLLGDWALERHIQTPEGNAVLNGECIFTKIDDVHLLCNESGILSINGKQIDTNRSYIYAFEDDRVTILYNDPHRKGDVLHDLTFQKQGHDYVATHCHLCGQDTYDLTFTMLPDDSIRMNYVVKGPHKDYAMQSVLSRIHRPFI